MGGVEVSPSSLNFGAVQVSTLATLQVTFTNLAASTELIAVNASQASPEFSVTDTAGPVSSATVQTLAPGATYVVTVTFAPDHAGNFSSSFGWSACASASSCTPAGTVFLNGVGVDGALQITPVPIGFNIPVGQTVTDNVTLANAGSNALTVTCIYFRSLGPSACLQNTRPFQFTGPSSPTLPQTLAIGQALPLQLTYTPSGTTGDTDELDVVYTSQGATVFETATDPLLGNQTLNPCQLTITPAALDFGDVTVGTPVDRTLTFTNSGQSYCEVTFNLDPSSDPSYSFAPSTPSGDGSFGLNLLAGTSVPITVVFNLNNSNTPAQRTGAIDYVSSDASNASGTIPLTATIGAAPGGWPQWHHDALRSGKSPADTSADVGAVVWQYAGLASAQALNLAAAGNTSGGPFSAGLAYVNSPVVSATVNGGYQVSQVSLDGNLVTLDQTGTVVSKLAVGDPTGNPFSATPVILGAGQVAAALDGEIASANEVIVASAGGGASAASFVSPFKDLPFGEPALSPDGTFFWDESGQGGEDGLNAVAFAAANPITSTLKAIPWTIPSSLSVAALADDSSVWTSDGQFFAVTSPANGFAPSPSWPAERRDPRRPGTRDLQPRGRPGEHGLRLRLRRLGDHARRQRHRLGQSWRSRVFLTASLLPTGAVQWDPRSSRHLAPHRLVPALLGLRQRVARLRHRAEPGLRRQRRRPARARRADRHPEVALPHRQRQQLPRHRRRRHDLLRLHRRRLLRPEPRWHLALQAGRGRAGQQLAGHRRRRHGVLRLRRRHLVGCALRPAAVFEASPGSTTQTMRPRSTEGT